MLNFGPNSLKIGVVVGTFGDQEKWQPLAERALDSVRAQTTAPEEAVWVHADTLQEARNEGAGFLIKEYNCSQLIFLDADDELDPGYVEAMTAAWEFNSVNGEHFLYRPITQGIHPDGTVEEPRWIERTDMTTRNCAVIGTMCPSQLFVEVGGFDDYPILEDWALWRKIIAAGAGMIDVGNAIYKVHVIPDSRNMSRNHGGPGGVYSLIRKRHPL